MCTIITSQAFQNLDWDFIYFFFQNLEQNKAWENGKGEAKESDSELVFN